MRRQSEEWLIALYSILADPRVYNPFEKCPLVRLEDGSHVVAFERDGTPNAFLPAEEMDVDMPAGLPMVKYSIANGEAARGFLVSLGLGEPDPVDLVLKRVLPKYKNWGKISEKTWLRDFRQIMKALRTDSSAKRQQLEEVLQVTPFLLVDSIDEDGICFVRPGEAYIESSELVAYFGGTDKVWMLTAGRYREEDLKSLARLGVASSPRIMKRDPRDGHVILVDRHSNHRRGLDGFDPDWKLDGLYGAVTCPNLERSKLLWKYLMPCAPCLSGIIETSKQRSFVRPDRERVVSPDGGYLIANAWIPNKEGQFCRPSDLSAVDFNPGLDASSSGARLLVEKLGLRKSEQQQAMAMLAGDDERRRRLLDALLNADDGLLDRWERLVPREQQAIEFPNFMEGLDALSRRPRNPKEPIPFVTGAIILSNIRKASMRKSWRMSSMPHKKRAISAHKYCTSRRFKCRCWPCCMQNIRASVKLEAAPFQWRMARTTLSPYRYCSGRMSNISTMREICFAYRRKWRPSSCTRNLNGWMIFNSRLRDSGRFVMAGKCIIEPYVSRVAGEECNIIWSERHFMRLIALCTQT